MKTCKFQEKIHPIIAKILDKYRRNGDRAVADSLKICFLKEVDYRLGWDSEDDAEDIPWLDDVDPKWFVNESMDVVTDWDGAPQMFCCDDTGYEAFRDFLDIMKGNWGLHGDGK